jgi:hypothetical protein
MSYSTAVIPSLSSLPMYATSGVATLSTLSLSSLSALTNWASYSAYSPTYSNSINTSYGKFTVEYDSIKVNDKFTVAGIDVGEVLKSVMERLCIIQDSSKHEQFAALKRAYDNYKVVEAMCVTSSLSTRRA